MCAEVYIYVSAKLQGKREQVASSLEGSIKQALGKYQPYYHDYEHHRFQRKT